MKVRTRFFENGTRVMVETPQNVWTGRVVMDCGDFISLTDVLNSDFQPVREKRIPTHRIVSICETAYQGSLNEPFPNRNA